MKKYIIKCTKRGKEWKKFTTGADFLEDDKLYRIEWELDSFISWLRGWIGILLKTPHSFIREES